MQIQNPILRGFNPDPSIIKTKDGYYIATSTFEWFPGVQIHYSKDLINWELVARPLNRISQLDMRGNPDSCGVWAPCLSYHNNTFYLVYSNVRSFDGKWKDTHNYLVTTDNILGEWSDPVYLNSSGFDASLFHDTDGKKWLLAMITDQRNNHFFGGITLQEYDEAEKRLTGPIHTIFKGTELGCTEGPHLYKKDGFYYLITAEGGTEYGHAVTVARSQSITGPYEVHPENPIITSRHHPEAELQKAGHADLIQDEHGQWLATFLVARPLSPLGKCILGRETAIELIDWPDNQWPQLKNGARTPRSLVSSNGQTPQDFTPSVHHVTFDQPVLDIHFQSLRVPIEESWATLTAKPGFLRLKGRESLSSFHYQSLIARRIQHFKIEASTYLEFAPVNFQQMAGLIFYYNTNHFHYLTVSCDDQQQKTIQVITYDKSKVTESQTIAIESLAPGIHLKGVLHYDRLQFHYKEADTWKPIGSALDASILSDDYVRDETNHYRPAFTGAFCGICCQDLSGQGKAADFKHFNYTELK
ncbi:glycoside hydrolase family 43 protein [Fulvivirga ligni]|uniref:glycoside hydrolase family 43 protein n=1 Tax=Fulvivirga ligni TaxID=2904246 RepID=UPI001F48FBC9|nr:glycoside hydrolase family 43 protein [Fulvivirga ligni]UII23848.1 glycoside hydrolase family 43 protein [Fulvivirga ligni]